MVFGNKKLSESNIKTLIMILKNKIEIYPCFRDIEIFHTFTVSEFGNPKTDSIWGFGLLSIFISEKSKQDYLLKC